MNLAIMNAIKQATNSEVTCTSGYSDNSTITLVGDEANENDATVTTYHISKLVKGKTVTVSIAVSAEITATVGSDELTDAIVKEAYKAFAELRKGVK